MIGVKTTTHTHVRSNSDADIETPRRTDSDLQSTKTSTTVDSACYRSDTSSPSKVMMDIEAQIRDWRISDDSNGRGESPSTVPIPLSSIKVHQKKESKTRFAESNGKEFTEKEAEYLQYVVTEMYKIIVASALGSSGVQYRNTIAWSFHVPPLASRNC
jgi:hypothetical protein